MGLANGGGGMPGMPPMGGGGGGAKKPQGPLAKAAAAVSNLYGGLINPTGGSSSSGSRSGGSGPAGKSVLGADHLNQPDFNSFRPNLPYDPTRAIAGKAGYRDGITGPETDIWEKVKTQYSQQHSNGAFLSQ